LTVEAQGFATLKQTDLVLLVSTPRTNDIKLNVASVATTVEVVSASQTINTPDATIWKRVQSDADLRAAIRRARSCGHSELAAWRGYCGGSRTGEPQLQTKSGTNEFHGTAYEYNRPTNTVANDYFNKHAELTAGEPNEPTHLGRNTFGDFRRADQERPHVLFSGV
jgi:hypothetical protein